jgi:hypothetical protein
MRRGTWLWLGLIGVVAVAALLPAAPYAQIPATDSAIFLYFGRGILNGQLPYRELLDNKPPLVFFLNALGLAFDGGSRWGVWALQLIFVLAAAVWAFFYLRKHFKEWVAAYAALAFLVNLVLVLERGNLSEEYALPFVFGGLLLFSGLDNQKGFRWRSYLFGASFSMALMAKQTMVGLWLALGLIYLVQVISSREWRRLWEVARWAAGAVAGLLPWILYFAARGILGDFWDVAFYFNFIYSATSKNPDRLAALAYELNFVYSSSGFFTLASLTWLGGLAYILFNHAPTRRVVTSRWIGVPLGIGALLLLYKAITQLTLTSMPTSYRLGQALLGLLLAALALVFLLGLVERRVSPWLGRFRSASPLPLLPLYIAVVDAPIELAMINVSTSNYAHYFMAILPCFTILVAWFIHMLVSWADERGARVLPHLWAVILLFPILQNGVSLIVEQAQVGKDVFVTSMAAYVRQNTKPDETVLTWGFNTQVNFLADRRFPTRYMTQLALFRPGYGSPARFQELLGELEAHPPRLILDTHLYPFVTWNTQSGQCSYDKATLPDGLDKVLDYVCQNYTLAELFGKDQWSVYRLRTP